MGSGYGSGSGPPPYPACPKDQVRRLQDNPRLQYFRNRRLMPRRMTKEPMDSDGSNTYYYGDNRQKGRALTSGSGSGSGSGPPPGPPPMGSGSGTYYYSPPP